MEIPDVPGTMSRASLTAEATELQGNILRNWDKTMEMSRAGLQAYLLEILGKTDAFLGQVGQEVRPVTGQPAAANTRVGSRIGPLI